MVWQYVKLNNGNCVNQKEITNNISNEKSEQDDKQQNENQQETNTPQENIKIENKEEDKNNSNVYSNYKNVKWCDKSVELASGLKVEIKDNKVYIIFAGEQIEVKGIDGNPYKVASYGVSIDVLTKEGKVYFIDDLSNGRAQLFEKISKYKIIDMTTQNLGIVSREIYYLTSEGELIDSKCETYENINKDFVGMYQKTSWSVYLSNNSSAYYCMNGENDYNKIKDENGKTIQAGKIFWKSLDYISGQFIILTKDNKLVYLKCSEDATIYYEKQKVKTYSIENNYDERTNINTYNLIFVMEDDSKIQFNNIKDYYDVNTNSVEKLK